MRARGLLGVAVVLASLDASANGITVTTFQGDPLGTEGTKADGISGDNVVGYYKDSSNHNHGFLYNGSTYTTIDDPNASPSGGGTVPNAISGTNVVGQYFDASGNGHGFLYNGSTFTDINDSLGGGVIGTVPNGISGSDVVGVYNNSGDHGFLYNGSTFMALNDPLGTNTVANGISGNDIVGQYQNSSHVSQGFLYNGSTYTTIDDPLSPNGSALIGISGSTILGYYHDNFSQTHYFLYSGSTFTNIDGYGPANESIDFAGISGNKLVGNANGMILITTIPEPSTIALLAIGAIGLAAMARCRGRR